MVGCVFGETHNLVFQAWAIARAGATDVAVVHWRVFDVVTNNLVRGLGRVCDIADRIIIIVFVAVGKPIVGRVAGLRFAY